MSDEGGNAAEEKRDNSAVGGVLLVLGLFLGSGATHFLDTLGRPSVPGTPSAPAAVYVSRSLQVGPEGVKQAIIKMISESTLPGRDKDAVPAVVFHPWMPRGPSANYEASWLSENTEVRSVFALKDVAADMTRHLQASGVIAASSRSVYSSVDDGNGQYSVNWEQPMVAKASAADIQGNVDAGTAVSATTAGPTAPTQDHVQGATASGATAAAGGVFPVAPHKP